MANITIPVNYLYIGLAITGVMFLALIAMIIIFILVKRNSHAFIEWKAKRKGIPIVMFFNDDNTVEWKPLAPEAGIISDKKYGAFVLNPESHYLDRNTKNIVIPVSSSVGVTVPAKLAEVTNALSKVIENPKKLAMLRKAITMDRLNKQKFNFLKETINFSHIKRMLNSITPHNIDAKINLMVARKLGSFGNNPTGAIVAFLLIGLALIALFAFVYKGKEPKVIVQTAQTMAKNATKVIS